MRGSANTNSKQPKIYRFSKESREFSNIREYLSNLNPIFELSCEQGYDVDDFKTLIDILQAADKEGGFKQFDISQVNDLKGFVNFFNRFIQNSYLNIKRFDKVLKTIEMGNDAVLKMANHTHFIIPIFPFYDNKHLFPASVFNHFKYRVHQHFSYLNSLESEIMYAYEYDLNYHLEEFHSINRIKPSMRAPSEAERMIDAKKGIAYHNKFIRCVQFKGRKISNASFEKLSEPWKEFVRTIDYAFDYDPEMVRPFCNTCEDFSSEYLHHSELYEPMFEDMEDLTPEDKRDMAIGYMAENTYPATFLLSGNDIDDMFSQAVLQMFNEKVNECLLELYLEEPSTIDHNGQVNMKNLASRQWLKRKLLAIEKLNEYGTDAQSGSFQP